MTHPTACSALYPTLSVPNVEETCAWYVEAMGFTLRFLWGEPPHHGAVMLDQACLHFWEGAAQLTTNWTYFDVADLDAIYARARAGGVTITKPPERYPWGMREFNAVDLNGYPIRFGQHVGDEQA
ncbi:MAG: VOC family protein [Pseudomonadota bacterium]